MKIIPTFEEFKQHNSNYKTRLNENLDNLLNDINELNKQYSLKYPRNNDGYVETNNFIIFSIPFSGGAGEEVDEFEVVFEEKNTNDVIYVDCTITNEFFETERETETNPSNGEWNSEIEVDSINIVNDKEDFEYNVINEPDIFQKVYDVLTLIVNK